MWAADTVVTGRLVTMPKTNPQNKHYEHPPGREDS